MDTDEYSIPQRRNASVTPNECYALKILYADGYTQSELAMMLGVGKGTVSKHLNDECKIHAIPDNHDN